MIYLIFSHKYREYQINNHIELISLLNEQIKGSIKEGLEIIEYKNTNAYKNKILKSEQSLKNKWEKVVYITSEQKFTKITKTNIEEESKKLEVEYKVLSEQGVSKNMSNIDKWAYFLFERNKEKREEARKFDLNNKKAP